MIIPWTTDAPVYYFPRATLGLIVTTTICLVCLCLGDSDEHQVGNWLLVYGKGLHPSQGVTSAFRHAGTGDCGRDIVLLARARLPAASASGTRARTARARRPRAAS